jgi:hypothetical protein
MSNFSPDADPGTPVRPTPAQAPAGGPAMSEMPRDPVALAGWLHENKTRLPPDERAMLDRALKGGQQVFASGPPIAVDMSDQDAKPGLFSRFASKVSDLAGRAADKIKGAFSRAGGEANEPPGDPAKYAEWLQQNPQAMSPQEQQIVAAQGKSIPQLARDINYGPDVNAKSGKDRTGSPEPQLRTNAEAHELAKEIARGHELGRGRQGPGLEL